MWAAMLAVNPALKVNIAQPSQQVFETESIQITMELALLRVNGRGPQGIEDVAENASALLRIASERLRLDTFKRAGFRLIKSKTFESSSKALEFIQVKDDLEQNTFGVEGSKTMFVKSERFESTKAGIQATLRAEEREWNFTAPWESRPHLPSSLSRKEWVVIADADYYTIGAVDRESFDVKTWIMQAQKAIKRQWTGV
jgi:hypothetical protein